MIRPAPLSMDTGISSAVGWINLTTLLLRFASFARAAVRAPVTRRAASYGFHSRLVSIQPTGTKTPLASFLPFGHPAPYRPPTARSPPGRRAGESSAATC